MNEIKIAILQRGWVFIGRFERKKNDCKLTNAFNIRRWGTTRGLGEIAKNGVNCNTVLDPAGTIEFDYLTVVALISCSQEKWEAKLNEQ